MPSIILPIVVILAEMVDAAEKGQTNQASKVTYSTGNWGTFSNF